MKLVRKTCDLCGAHESLDLDQSLGCKYPWELFAKFKGWQVIPVKGNDADVCPACWKRIVEAVAAKLPLEMKQ